MNSTIKIVVVEDEIDLLEMICLSLRRAGYKVFSAKTCSEGLTAVYSEQPLLLLTDHLLPDERGSELIRKIKNDPRISSVKTILMTAGSRLSVSASAPDLLLMKPFALKDLNSMIDQMVY
jgi:two-component system phosphate regulon response regulator PhoB